jgi:hypothetical protein
MLPKITPSILITAAARGLARRHNVGGDITAGSHRPLGGVGVRLPGRASLGHHELRRTTDRRSFFRKFKGLRKQNLRDGGRSFIAGG